MFRNVEIKNYGAVSNIKLNLENSEPDWIPILQGETNNKGLFYVSKHTAFFGMFCCVYVMFLVGGACSFAYFETPGEMDTIVALQTSRRQFIHKYPNVKDDDLESLISEVVKASNRGVSAARNVSGEPNWSFGQSLFFSSTVITTIGYGHVTPLSRGGKVFCMLYAMVGIPLTLVLLSALVERLLSPSIWFLQWLNSRLGHLYQPFNIRLIHLFIIVLFFLSAFILAPAGIFAAVEPEWDYMDSLYYCFISLTTIGLGDYIPGDAPDQPYRPLYKIVTTVYLFIGIIFMMLCLSVFYDIPQLNLGLLFKPEEDTNSEKVRLAGAGLGLHYGLDASYSPQNEDNTHRRVVRVRSRRDDSPSPEEMAPAKELRVP